MSHNAFHTLLVPTCQGVATAFLIAAVLKIIVASIGRLRSGPISPARPLRRSDW